MDIFHIYKCVLIFGALFSTFKYYLECALCFIFKDYLGFDFITCYEWNNVVLDYHNVDCDKHK